MFLKLIGLRIISPFVPPVVFSLSSRSFSSSSKPVLRRRSSMRVPSLSPIQATSSTRSRADRLRDRLTRKDSALFMAPDKDKGVGTIDRSADLSHSPGPITSSSMATSSFDEKQDEGLQLHIDDESHDEPAHLLPALPITTSPISIRSPSSNQSTSFPWSFSSFMSSGSSFSAARRLSSEPINGYSSDSDEANIAYAFPLPPKSRPPPGPINIGPSSRASLDTPQVYPDGSSISPIPSGSFSPPMSALLFKSSFSPTKGAVNSRSITSTNDQALHIQRMQNQPYPKPDQRYPLHRLPSTPGLSDSSPLCRGSETSDGSVLSPLAHLSQLSLLPKPAHTIQQRELPASVTARLSFPFGLLRLDDTVNDSLLGSSIPFPRDPIASPPESSLRTPIFGDEKDGETHVDWGTEMAMEMEMEPRTVNGGSGNRKRKPTDGYDSDESWGDPVGFEERCLGLGLTFSEADAGECLRFLDLILLGISFSGFLKLYMQTYGLFDRCFASEDYHRLDRFPSSTLPLQAPLSPSESQTSFTGFPDWSFGAPGSSQQSHFDHSSAISPTATMSAVSSTTQPLTSATSTPRSIPQHAPILSSSLFRASPRSMTCRYPASAQVSFFTPLPSNPFSTKAATAGFPLSSSRDSPAGAASFVPGGPWKTSAVRRYQSTGDLSLDRGSGRDVGKNCSRGGRP